MKRDPEKSAAANFLDKRSFVRPDGRVVMSGKDNRDWNARKWELWQRAGGRCEVMNFSGFPPQRCPNQGEDPHHIKGNYIDDSLEEK